MATKYVKGGDRLVTALAEISRSLSSSKTLRVGFFEGATYPDSDLNAPTVAAIQEFGAPSVNIPPRPFFRNMIAKHESEWPEQITGQLRITKGNAKVTMQRMGALIASELQQSIIDTNAPPLAASTIAEKGFDKPLVRTAQMLNSVNYEVDDTMHEGAKLGNPYGKAS